METHTPQDHFTTAKLQIDAKLVEDLKTLEIINGAADLSRACGKNPTYFACMRKRGYSLHVGSLAFLMARLSRQIAENDDVRIRARLRTAMVAINEAIQEKCKLREQELLSDAR